MSMLFKIAIKNLLGARLRPWLNVFVTAISFFLIVLMSGMYDGMREHAKQVSIETEIAGGAYWHPQSQASIYPNDRIMPVIMKGISPAQTLVNLPTSSLNDHNGGTIPVLIGAGMADYAKLKVGDSFTIRWLDADRTYDADEGTVVHIMQTENFKVDMGHIWLPLEKTQTMLAMEGEATYVIHEENLPPLQNSGDWIARDVQYLIRDMEAMIEADEPNARIMYFILLALAAMGIFNAQVLSIFRRGREIGTLMALGMTRSRVVGLFTLEGGLNAFLAAIVTVVLFGPLLWYLGVYGFDVGIDYSEMGLIVARRLIPVYSVGLLVTTMAVVSVIVLVVSYMR